MSVETTSEPLFYVELGEATIHTVTVVLNSVELVLIVGVYPVIFSVFYLFYNCALFHRNLKWLIANSVVEFVVLSLTRLFVVVGDLFMRREASCSRLTASQTYFSGPFSAAEMIRLVACTAFLLNCPCTVVERFVATVHFKKYERVKCFKLVMLSNALQWVFGATLTYLFLGNIVPITLIVGIEVFITSLSGVVVVVSYRMNTRLYNKYMACDKVLDLTGRYQLAENLRSQRMILKISYSVAVINIFCLAIFVTMHFGAGNFLQVALKAVFDLTVALYCYVFPIMALVYLPFLRRQYLQFFCARIRNKIAPAHDVTTPDLISSLSDLRDSQGRQMVFDVDKERQVYFDTLKAFWSMDIPPKHCPREQVYVVG